MEEEIEEFRDIPGYEGRYQISSFGRVWSMPKEWPMPNGGTKKHSGIFLKQRIDKDGYYYLNVRLNTKKTFKIHQLVAMVFLNHKPDGTQKIVIDHRDNDKSNNKPSNLQLITNRLNASKDVKNKTSKYTGVSWNKLEKKYKSQIKINGKTKHLGSFISEEEASEAYQSALLNLTITEEECNPHQNP